MNMSKLNSLFEIHIYLPKRWHSSTKLGPAAASIACETPPADKRHIILSGSDGVSRHDVQFRHVRRRSKVGPAVADQAAVISQVGQCTPVEALVDQNHHLKQNPLPDW